MDNSQDNLDCEGRPGDGVSCGEYRGEIPLVIGGDLEPEVLDLLVAHLAECQPCADLSAQAALARDALLEGLEAGAQAWTQPKLWPGVAAAVDRDALGSDEFNPERVAPILRFSRAAGRLILPLAAAALLFMMLRPDQAGSLEPAPKSGDGLVGIPSGSTFGDSESPQGESGLPGNSWFDESASAEVASSAETQVPWAREEPRIHGVPSGLLEPLTLQDQRELDAATGLRVDMDAQGILRIRQGEGAVLTSLRVR